MKKLLFVLSLAIMLTFAFVLMVGAVNYDEIATLADGTMLPVYDSEHNPLIWYVSGTDENGKNVYTSVPNNRNEANGNGDTYVTYTINTSWMTQLENINFHVWNAQTGEYEVFTEENYEVVVVNLRGLTSFEYINQGLKVSNIQYIYFNENLKDFCKYFGGSTALRLVDLSECTTLTGGFGGTRNLYNCSNLHTVRLAPGARYSLVCTANNNWRFAGTAIVELVIPSNVTSLGVDNFKNCAQLESIYILGNTTSLGQRNFLNCTNLTNVYILGDNPQIDITSFEENFNKCVDGNTTHNFSSVGKYFFFVTEDTAYLNQVKDAIGGATIITYDDYVTSPEDYTEGRYIISGTSICEVYYGEHSINAETANNCVGVCEICNKTVINHNETQNLLVTIEYASYDKNGTKTTVCKNEGCTYTKTESAQALFECLGYSIPVDGRGGIAIGYKVNNSAVTSYEQATGNDLAYGVFAVSQQKLDKNDVFAQDGTPTNGVITAEITSYEFIEFALKIVGFADSQKETKIAMGAYVAKTDENGTTYSYIQASAPNQGDKYSFASYNDIIEITSGGVQ